MRGRVRRLLQTWIPRVAFLALVALPAPGAHAAIPASQRQALLDLYSSTNGPGWYTKTGWNGAAGTECTWYGVRCDAAQGNVTELRFYSNGLGGPLPATFCNLTSLWYVDLSSNAINTAIPSFAGCTALAYLDLGYDGLTGTIPSFASNTALYMLNLEHNGLSGSIPSFAANGELRQLFIPYNKLTGSIPSFDRNPKLTTLMLHSNQLSGSIPSFASNPALTELFLQVNALTGGVPSFAANPKLQSLYLYVNPLGGTIPSFASNPALVELNLSWAQLTGTIPSFAANPALTFLDLTSNQLSGEIPSLAANTALQRLWLDHNQLTGTIPSLATNTALQSVTLEYNQLTGSIPSLASCTALQDFTAHWNRLSGPFPTFAAGTALRYFDLASNMLSGPIDPSLKAHTGIGSLDIGWNALYSTDPALTAFLNTKDYDWEKTQTIAPTGLGLSGVLPTQATLSWTPIAYTSDPGTYQVLYGNASGGPYTLYAETAGKATSSVTVTGLAPGTPYYFVVRSTTSAHANNQNKVLSESTPEVSILPPPVATRFYSLPPCRVFDTRNSSGPDAASPSLSAGPPRIFETAGRCGIPSTARSLSINVAVVSPTAPGYLSLYPGNLAPPRTSTINFRSGQTKANNAVLVLATDGTGRIGVVNGSAGSLDFILDVNGYFE